MAHNHTVMGQILKLVSRHEFEREARRHHKGQKLRKMTRWGQFVAMAMGQLSVGVENFLYSLTGSTNTSSHQFKSTCRVM